MPTFVKMKIGRKIEIFNNNFKNISVELVDKKFVLLKIIFNFSENPRNKMTNNINKTGFN
jgi:hypothetical protein